jgi:hypothetical protein
MSWPDFTASASLGPTLKMYRARHRQRAGLALPQQSEEVDESTLEEVTAVESDEEVDDSIQAVDEKA